MPFVVSSFICALASGEQSMSVRDMTTAWRASVWVISEGARRARDLVEQDPAHVGSQSRCQPGRANLIGPSSESAGACLLAATAQSRRGVCLVGRRNPFG